ncbi:cyclopropane-fatty-acyl-phospholipid synthase family protein [Pedobacter sp. SYSU D00535]|uniref:SAM-dependent methyltransferase n=1 Tax=Pedobacter sp. SYSU D00535 TaxID=2810308 RepID=UPI001A96B707|nr:class I SAM-dependent methyltransferase [Pedobacter sp. SYSU D00535]
MSRKWYQNWFNSPYYHILYHQRNDEEAEFLIDNLCSFLQPNPQSRILDIACGRGRHSVYLNKKGYDVTGIDLSHSNIKFSKQFENEKLHFHEHDMRHLLYINYFDLALNLFTSFGYFETERDHVKALKTFRKALKPEGRLVLDYFNTEKIVRNLTRQELKLIDGIDFSIAKKVENGKIIKSISFEHRSRGYNFKEEVKAFSFSDFEKLFKLSGFEVENHFGDYSLNAFDPVKSDRLIFICKKSDA